MEELGLINLGMFQLALVVGLYCLFLAGTLFREWAK